MPRAKPGQRFGGRQKGTPNKINKELKEMILEALHNSGGVEYLTGQAVSNPSAFLTLIGKVLPLTITGDPSNPLKTDVTVRFVGNSDTKQV